MSAIPTSHANFVVGLDQRKLFIAAKDWLPKLGYREVKARTTACFSPANTNQRSVLTS